LSSPSQSERNPPESGLPAQKGGATGVEAVRGVQTICHATLRPGVDKSAVRRAFREQYRRDCFQSGIDYVALDTSMQFDKALTEYLLSRRARY